MHSKCIEKRVESCSLPCTLQKTKRGNFCIYNPGSIEDVFPVVSDMQLPWWMNKRLRLTSSGVNKNCIVNV